MLAYSTIVALYLANLGFAGSVAGVLLWPAVVLHAILTALLTWASAREKKRTRTQAKPTSNQICILHYRQSLPDESDCA
jgi:hypothetical protein